MAMAAEPLVNVVAMRVRTAILALVRVLHGYLLASAPCFSNAPLAVPQVPYGLTNWTLAVLTQLRLVLGLLRVLECQGSPPS